MGTPAESKVAIVTGAASGIGSALAKHLVAKAWKVALFDVNDSAGQKLATELGSDTAYFHVDVSSYDSQATAFLQVFKKWGRIDALLANAGICDRSSVFIFNHRDKAADDIPPAPSTACTDIDYKGVVYGTQLAIHFMRHNSPKQGGKIVATSTASAIRPFATYPEYNGAKAAVVAFVRGTAGVLNNKENIYMNVVCPGLVETNIITPDVAAAAGPHLTAVDTVVRAYDEFLRDEDERFGQAVEATVDKVLPLEEPRLANGEASKRGTTVWDPLFERLHGEGSGLVDAIP